MDEVFFTDPRGLCYEMCAATLHSLSINGGLISLKKHVFARSGRMRSLTLTFLWMT